jgi:hypothetical protein
MRDREYAFCLLKAIKFSPDKESFRIYSQGNGARSLDKYMKLGDGINDKIQQKNS